MLIVNTQNNQTFQQVIYMKYLECINYFQNQHIIHFMLIKILSLFLSVYLSLEFYPEINNNVGYFCNITNCLTCSDVNYCAFCKQGYLWSINQDGRNYCAQIQCNIQNCRYCYSPNICQQCSDGFFISETGKCMKGQSQYYCAQNCLNCTSSTKCNLCSYGFNPKGSQCIENVPTNDYYCKVALYEDICQICREGTYLFKFYQQMSNRCSYNQQNIQCNLDNCFHCTNDNYCDTCKAGSSLLDGKCIQNYCTDKNCIQCYQNKQECIMCLEGYQIKQGNCVIKRKACDIQHCIVCGGESYCSNCQEGYRLKDVYRYGSQMSSTVICQKQSQDEEKCMGKGLLPLQISSRQSHYGCNKCSQGFINIQGQSCVANLSLGKYKCQIRNCEYCIFPNYCGKCIDGAMLHQQTGACWVMRSQISHCKQQQVNSQLCLQCGQNYILIPDVQFGYSGVCVEKGFTCPKGCSYCIQNGKCQVCRDGFTLVQQKCVAICQIQNCYRCLNQTSCDLCEYGFLPNNDFSFCNISGSFPTKPCDSQYQQNCLICNIYGDCLKCKNGYNLQFGSCQENSTQNLTGCKNYLFRKPLICSECQPGFLLIDGHCYSLSCNIPNCQFCLRSQKCQICSHGFLLNEEGICQTYTIKQTCNITNCAICNGSGQCVRCLDGYKFYEGICVCPFQNCQKCLGDVVCVQCSANFFPVLNEDGGCAPTLLYEVLCQVQNCAQCFTMNKCSNCFIGYTLSLNGTCQKRKCKQSSCQLCFGKQQYCYLCKQGYTPNNVFSSKCLPAPSDYSCTIPNCAYCSAPNTCVFCYDTYKLQNNICHKKTCPDNCAYCFYEDKCVVCLTDYKLTQNKTCSYQRNARGLQDCSKIDSCLQCQVDYYLDKVTCNVCIPGFQPSVDGSSCNSQKCTVENCQTCIPYATSPSLQSSLCMICENGYFLNSYLQCIAYAQAMSYHQCKVSQCIACSSKDNYCTSCLPGWNPINGRCFSYISSQCTYLEGCSVCMGNDESLTQCYSCSEGFILSQQNICIRQVSRNNTIWSIIQILITIVVSYLIYLLCAKKMSQKNEGQVSREVLQNTQKFKNSSLKDEIM